MHFSSAILITSAASAVAAVSMSARQHESFSALKGVMERQLTVCKPVPPPVTCARSCGEGYVQCVLATNCYNPGAGESCCSNGKYCPAGQYCTDGGCCPDGTPLAECGATITLSVIPPPAAEPTSTPAPGTTSTPAPTPTYGTTPTETPEESTSSSAETTTEEPTTTAAPTTTKSSNGTATTTPPLQVTNAAQAMGLGPIQAAIGGLGALFMLL